MRLKKINDEQLFKMLIDEMFIIAGHTDVQYEDIVDRKDNWFQEYTMTVEQNDKWRESATKIIMRERRWPRYRAKREMDWISLCYGLKLIDYGNITSK
jgi:hypothetical protein